MEPEKTISCEPEVKCIEASYYEDFNGKSHFLYTLQCKYWRSILPEVNTHRAFSRNSRSSRATPTKVTLDRVTNMPWGPSYWGANESGMVANHALDPEREAQAKAIWIEAAKSAVAYGTQLAELGVHKQDINRLLEPFLGIETLITVQEEDLEHFYNLRISKDAQPEFRKLAEKIREAISQSHPIQDHGTWGHLPYIQSDDYELVFNGLTSGKVNSTGKVDKNDPTTWGIEELCYASAARCARVSYSGFDGKKDLVKDLELGYKLKQAGHLSPFEHVCTRIYTAQDIDIRDNVPSNLSHWISLRRVFEALDRKIVSKYEF